MKTPWPMVRLEKLLIHDDRYMEPEPRIYAKLSVKLYGRGVVLDAPADGATLRMRRHQLARAGQVILSEIWGKKGAIGFVPPDGDGALWTSHFFLFDVRDELLDPDWLGLIFRANYLEEQLSVYAKGTTGYAAVRPKMLLTCEIPLPPLAEQRRLVARIEGLAAHIHEAQDLRSEAAEQTEGLFQASIEMTYRGLRDRLGSLCLADVCETITDGDHNTPAFTDTGVRFIFVGNVSTGRLHFGSSKRVAEQYFKALSPQRVPVRGDILYSAVRGGAAFSDKESGCVKWMNCSSVTAIMPTQRSSDHETLS
jgi:type I restriction enzyme, S subunit